MIRIVFAMYINARIIETLSYYIYEIASLTLGASSGMEWNSETSLRNITLGQHFMSC